MIVNWLRFAPTPKSIYMVVTRNVRFIRKTLIKSIYMLVFEKSIPADFQKYISYPDLRSQPKHRNLSILLQKIYSFWYCVFDGYWDHPGVFWCTPWASWMFLNVVFRDANPDLPRLQSRHDEPWWIRYMYKDGFDLHADRYRGCGSETSSIKTLTCQITCGHRAMFWGARIGLPVA